MTTTLFRYPLLGATRPDPHGNLKNEDHFVVLPDAAIVIDGAGRANGAARKIGEQFRRLVNDSPPESLPDMRRLAGLLHSFSPARATMAAVRIVEVPSGLAVLSCVVGDAKVALWDRNGQLVYVSEASKNFLGGSAAIDPEAMFLRPGRGSLLVLASDGAWNALGGVQIPRHLAGRDPSTVLEGARLLDDATLVTVRL